MRRAPAIGAGLAVAAVGALALSLGGTNDAQDDGSAVRVSTTSRPDPGSPSTDPQSSGMVGDPVEADEGLPPSTVTTGPSTSAPQTPSVYDPRKTDEDLPPGYRLLLQRDEIRPIYGPTFIDADSVDWPPDTLVIGVAGETEAKAYPVIHLTAREMVNDTLDGSPILVSW